MASSQLVQSLLRGLDILDALAQAEDGLRLNEIASRLGVGASTAHNLLRTLASRQLVEQQGRLYLPGAGLGELAGRASRLRGYRTIAAAIAELAKRHPDATLTVAEAIGAEVRVRLRMSPDRPGTLQRPGTAFSLYGSISALVIQAYVDDEQLERLRRQCPFIEFGSHLWHGEAALQAFLRGIRQAGYGVLPFQDSRMLRVAVPWFAANQHLLGTLGISLPARPDLDPQDLVGELIQAARRPDGIPEQKGDGTC